MSLLTYIYKYNNSHYILFETSYSKPCQLIQPERDPETKRQNEKIVTHKQEAAIEYTQVPFVETNSTKYYMNDLTRK